VTAFEWASLTVAGAFIAGTIVAAIALLRLLKILEHRDRGD
jgi:hypothetical protein